MDWFEPIDQYCERTTGSLWGEPLNFVSNIGFIIAGILVLKALRRAHIRNQKSGPWLLTFFLFLIGIGSALFHSFANVWSMWADVIPIAIFVITYLWLFLREIVGASAVASLLALTFFTILSALAAWLSNPATANGSEAYFGTLIALFGISCYYAGRRQSSNQRRLLVATLIFAGSLSFRTIDTRLCDVFPYGTHVFWHLCNSVVLYLVTAAYISERGRPQSTKN
jgi:hypothetical protein